jgi:hypothetical protein
LLGLVAVCLSVPAVAVAAEGGKGCSLIGTWFGFDPATQVLTGWMINVHGKSNNQGTNDLEYPTFDPTLNGAFPAVRLSSLRGVWKRTGGNTFDYSFMGIAVDGADLPVWIGRVSGSIELSSDCNSEKITAGLDIYLPDASPFDDEPYLTLPLPTHYGHRFELQ